MANTARDLIKCRISNAPGTSGGFNVLAAAVGFLALGSGDDGLPFKLNITENGIGTEIRKNCTFSWNSGTNSTFTRGTVVRSTGTNDAALNFTSAAIISVVPSAEDSLTAEQAAAVTVFSAPVGIMEQYLLADGAKISAAVYDAAHFGFQASERTWPTSEADLITAAPDSSSAARNLEAFLADWATTSKQPVIVRFGPGVYKFDAINFAQNAEVFYPNNGLIIQGAGSHATSLCATTSSKAQFIGISGKTNWTRAPAIQGVTIVGAGGANPYQVGVFLNPDFVNSLGFGGFTSVNWKDVVIRGFAREQLWLKGGSEDYLVPVQFGVWEDILVTTNSTTYPALRLTGQVGTPFNFKNMQCYGASNTPVLVAIGLDTRTGITVSAANAGTNTLTFSTPHRFKTGDRFQLPTVSGTAWGGLSLDTNYWAYRVDDFSIKVCNSYANATASTPVFVTLTSTAGTATASTTQSQGVNQSPGNVIFETLTLQQGIVGMDLTGTALVFIDHLHGEETQCQVRVSAQSIVNIHHAAHGSPAISSGTLYDASSGGQIHLTGVHAVSGNVGKLLAGANGSVSGPDQWVGTLYKTTGNGISGKTSGYMQLGNDAEVALGQRVNGEYILNTGTTVVQHISAQSSVGQRVMFKIWPATGDWIEFGIAGNLNLHSKALIGSPATMRIPVGSFVTFTCTSINEGWSLNGLELPVHSASWTLSGDVSANSSVSKTVTCPGARVGDIAPAVSVSAALTAGLILVAEVTATDTVTVRIVNPTAGALAAPTNPTVYVRQQR